jgi:hypothetical protein
MDFQRFQVVTGPDREIIVELSQEAFVTVMDSTNLHFYESGTEYEYHGPREKVTNTRIKAQTLGRWFIIVESGPEVSVKWSLTDKEKNGD